MTLNTISNINELEYFRSQVQKLKQTYPQIYENAYNNLPEIKKEYFRNLLSTVKIGD